VLRDHGIEISMDGRGRCHDNIFVERLWWTVKHEWVYLRPAANGIEQMRYSASAMIWSDDPPSRVSTPPTALPRASEVVWVLLIAR
jgi:transposase InsO family protein